MLLFCGLSLSIVFKIITNEIQELAWNFIAEDIFQYSIFAIIHKPTLCITRVLEDELQAFSSNFCLIMTKHINDDSALGKPILQFSTENFSMRILAEYYIFENLVVVAEYQTTAKKPSMK